MQPPRRGLEIEQAIVLVTQPRRNGALGLLSALAFLFYINKSSERVQKRNKKANRQRLDKQANSLMRIDSRLRDVFLASPAQVDRGLPQMMRSILGKTCGWREVVTGARLSFFLLVRTAGSVWVSRHWGSIVQSVVAMNFLKLAGLVAKFGATSILLSLLNAMLKYEFEALRLQVREKITRWLHATYMRPGDMIYYKANKVGDQKIENCDHQMASDVEKFANSLADVMTKMNKPIVDLLVYSVVLSSVQGLTTPLSLYTWFAFTSFISASYLPPFGDLAATGQRLEGCFRSRHSDVITNCEQIAFLRGERLEEKNLNEQLDKLLVHRQHSMNLAFNSEVVNQYLLKYFVTVIGLFLISRPLLKIQFQGGPNPPPEQLARYFSSNWRYMENMSTAITNLFELTYRVGTLSGFAARVDQLMCGLEVRPPVLSYEIERAQRGPYPPTFKQHDALKFEHVSIYKPDGTLLVKDLNFSVEKGSRILVTGPNGAGKSSLFRVIQGLWPLVEGTITMPPAKDIHFLTQVNFVPAGTLRDLVIYPQSHEEMKANRRSDKEIMGCLRWAHVSPRVVRNNRAELEFTDGGEVVRPGLDDVRDWQKDLSPGQKQRLAFARLFYHRPSFVVLDECTNGVSPDVEHDLYDRCAQLKLAVFSIAHKIELKLFHDYELHYSGDVDGSWTLSKCSETRDKVTRSSALVKLPQPDESGKLESKITYERHVWFAE